jgi:cytochrome c-type protein NapB
VIHQQSENQLHLVALLVVLLVGTVGFWTGISRRAEPQGYGSTGRSDTAVGDEAEAPTQAELTLRPYGPNADRFADNLAQLVRQRRSPTDRVDRPSDSEWNQAVASRNERRAFAGAPPVVPHAMTQQGFPSCLACHREGVVIDGRTAPSMSHGELPNCAQCHVASELPLAWDASQNAASVVENSFVPLERWGRGSRAAPGAPPTIPHSTHLREQCASCHGVLTQGLHTSHAGQQSCQQCHLSPPEPPQWIAPLTGGSPPPRLAPSRLVR